MKVEVKEAKLESFKLAAQNHLGKNVEETIKKDGEYLGGGWYRVKIKGTEVAKYFIIDFYP